MKFLIDQDVYAATARFLTELGHTVHSELARVLRSYSQDVLKTAFVVIESGGYRIRWLSE